MEKLWDRAKFFLSFVVKDGGVEPVFICLCVIILSYSHLLLVTGAAIFFFYFFIFFLVVDVCAAIVNYSVTLAGVRKSICSLIISNVVTTVEIIYVSVHFSCPTSVITLLN